MTKSEVNQAAPPTTLTVNNETRTTNADPETPLLYVLRNDFKLLAARYGCGDEQCNACKVLIDGADTPSCNLPIKRLQDASIVTLEGLAERDNLHPLQEAFLEEQAAQCGYCIPGMIIAAQGLLNRVRYPGDDQIRESLDHNLCRCGVYDRVRRAIKLRIGRPIWEPVYTVIDMPPLPDAVTDVGLPPSIQNAPQLDQWISIDESDTVSVYTGKVELGQGIKTALAMIAAEELNLSLTQIRVVTADTQNTPDEGLTAGSMSVPTSGAAVRVAAAEARQFLLNLAHEHLEALASPQDLDINDGRVTDPQSGRSVDYWTLMGGAQFRQAITGAAPLKSPDDYTIVGHPAQRLDLKAKLTGDASYIHDLQAEDILHGRIVFPPNGGATLINEDTESVLQMPGVVAVHRDGSFLGVIADDEFAAIQAAGALAVSAEWEPGPPLPDQSNQYQRLIDDASESILIKDGAPVDDPIPPREDAALRATYYRPFQMHGSLGPSAAMARFVNGELTVWSHTQGAFNLQATLARVLEIPVDAVRVIHMEGAGCYGHNGADDAALDAALLARAAPGRPLLLKWMRADEHRWEPYSSAMVLELQASMDADGVISNWSHDVWTYTHSTRPNPRASGVGLLSSWRLAQPFEPPKPKLINWPEFGGHRNADPKYAFKRRRIVKHFAPQSPLRVSAMRSLGAYANIFAIESFMDELAESAGADPVEFRLRHLDDPRAVAVIEAVAGAVNWTPRQRPSRTGSGRGIAFAQYKNQSCYTGLVVDLDVNRDSGVITLKSCTIAADAGQIVNPDGLSNQLEGGFVQAASWTLFEQVNYSPMGIDSVDWDTYPILRFSNAPVINTILLNRPDMPFIGGGEATQGPAPAAIANAVYDALGLRLRELPFTPERVRAALQGAKYDENI